MGQVVRDLCCVVIIIIILIIIIIVVIIIIKGSLTLKGNIFVK